MAVALSVIWVGLIVWDQSHPNTISMQALSAAGAIAAAPPSSSSFSFSSG